VIKLGPSYYQWVEQAEKINSSKDSKQIKESDDELEEKLTFSIIKISELRAGILAWASRLPVGPIGSPGHQLLPALQFAFLIV